MGAPALLSVVPPTHESQQAQYVEPTPPSVGLGDIFDEEQQKELYRTGVEALATIAKEGNDNAKMGAAAKLVDLFKKTAQRSNKKDKIRISWRNPLESDDTPDEGAESIDDLLQ